MGDGARVAACRNAIVSDAESVERWRRIKELFAAVVDLGEDQRVSRLAQSPPELASEVERLLSHLDGSGPLDKPVLASVNPDAALWSTSLIGRSIGVYRVNKEIGRGGMGTVYLALREDGEFDQRVAIKALRLGVSSPAIGQRFRQERQILAGLQHPHIASLLDGGVTSDGVPYLVLEYIDGQPIDHYCAEHQLSLSGRIDLFRQVLDAVAYAHRQLIVHRDLKPSNILVTKDGVVKLVDFGIAKMLGAADGEATADGWQAFTAAYAAPEQVFGATISTATDIYALGVVLYLLLCGNLPYDVLGRSPGEAVEIIRDTESPAPSAAVSISAAVTRGFLRADQLARALRGELDAIVLMALRKEPSRRYQSATVFADDLHAYLKGMPVSARPDTFTYRVRKLVRRRWPIVAGASVGVVALLAGTAVALWQAGAAREEARRAALTSSFLRGMIGAADLSSETPSARLGPGASAAEFLDSAVVRMPTALRDDPRGRASLYFSFGKAYFTQERYREAAVQFDSALAISQRIDGDNSLSVANALRELGTIALLAGDGDRAEALLKRALAIFEGNGALGTPGGIMLLTSLAMNNGFRGHIVVAESLFKRGLELESRANRGPTVTKAILLSHLGGLYGMLSPRSAAADSLWKRSIDIFDALPNVDVVEKGVVLWYEALAESARGHLQRADSLSLAALAIYRRAAGPVSPEYAGHLSNLASFARTRGDTALEHKYIAEAISIIEKRPETPSIVRMRIETEFVRFHALAVKNMDSALVWARKANAEHLGQKNPYRAQSELVLGSILRIRGEFAESEHLLLDALEGCTRSLNQDSEQTQLVIYALVTLYVAWGRPADANEYRKRLVTTTR